MKLEILLVLVLCLALVAGACRTFASMSESLQPNLIATSTLEPGLPDGTPGTERSSTGNRPEATSRPSVQPNTIERNVTYCTMDGVELKMDLYYPGKVDRPAPAIVYLHGGGWSSGDKREAERIWEILKYFSNPYVLVSVNYRLAPAYRFPAQIVDVKCAIRHLRANAARYQIDPERIGVMGASAGGHLAALLGLSDESAGWDAGENLDQSSRVKSVVVVSGPADFTGDFPEGSRAIAKSVFGVTDRSDPMLKRASPVTYISAGDPPFLILQGEKDDQVPAGQAWLLYDRLRAAGVPADLVLIKNAGHGLRPVGGAISPSQLEVAVKIARFFSENL